MHFGFGIILVFSIFWVVFVRFLVGVSIYRARRIETLFGFHFCYFNAKQEKKLENKRQKASKSEKKGGEFTVF